MDNLLEKSGIDLTDADLERLARRATVNQAKGNKKLNILAKARTIVTAGVFGAVNIYDPAVMQQIVDYLVERPG
jgi:hypothetical protein